MHIVGERAGPNSRPPRRRPRKWLGKLRSLLSPPPRSSVTEDQALCILELRRGRDAALGRDLFADPAWDILLELYAARLSDSRLAVRDLANSINLPERTAARWICVLAEHGLVLSRERVGENDTALDLSPKTEKLLTRLLEEYAAAFRSI